MVLGKITESLFAEINNQLDKEDVREKLNSAFVNPIAAYVKSYLRPYFIILGLLLFVLLAVLFRMYWLICDIRVNLGQIVISPDLEIVKL
jgi:hypothetical protein